MNEIDRLKDAIIGAIDEIDRILYDDEFSTSEFEREDAFREVANRLHRIYHSNLTWEETQKSSE